MINNELDTYFQVVFLTLVESPRVSFQVSSHFFAGRVFATSRNIKILTATGVIQYISNKYLMCSYELECLMMSRQDTLT